jgi:hypothetical protein
LYEDKQYGKKVEKLSDGSKYKGHNHDGNKHGDGCLKFADGSKHTSKFKK